MLSFNSMLKAVDCVVKSGHVPCLVGLQGIGKSDLVRTYARNKGYAYTEITCSLLQEGDLAMPFVVHDEDNDYVKYSINEVVRRANDLCCTYERSILFLDEFNRGTPQTQSELMNLVLQRRLDGYELNANVSIILAMNPSSEMEGYEDSDYSVSFSDSAILGRVVLLKMNPSVVDWLSYAKGSGVHEAIISFISNNRELFYTKEVSGAINNTPRGWVRASDILKAYEEMGIQDDRLLREMLSGTLVGGTALRFIGYYKDTASSINYFDLAEQVMTKNPDEYPELMFKLNDADLDKVFTIAADIFAEDPGNDEKLEKLVTFILAVDDSLMYTWITRVESKNPDLYLRLIEEKRLSEYVLTKLSGIKNMERSGFSGK